MSDIRFNRWLHQSGTGGVSQDSSGHIGIGTTVPTMALDVRGNVNFSDTVNATTLSAVDGTFTGNVTIGGTLTYEDVANIDAVGIITAQSDIIVGGGLTVTGISTFNNDVKLLDNDKLKFGIDEDLQIYHDGSKSLIADSGTGHLEVNTNDFRVQNAAANETIITGTENGAVDLYYDNSRKFQTTNTGAVVTGILTATSSITGPNYEIADISSSISDTAVDVFVYDTSKDSDGGAWRKRTQHTSWYNETLNTATRGSRKEFPAVAVIVCTNTQVRIYDGDDPDLPLWMEFVTGGNWSHILVSTAGYIKAAEMLNGELVIARNLNTGWQLVKVSFISDTAYAYKNAAHGTGDGEWYGGIASRNGYGGYTTISTASNIVSQYNNDVAMTVLPNAPIDDTTGLPIPTIAVGTDGGVSVIRDDGNVVDITITTGANNDGDRVDFTDDNRVVVQWGGDAAGEITIDEIPSSDISQNYPINLPGSHYNDNSPESYSPIFLTEGPSQSNRHPTAIQQFRAVGTTAALSLFDENKTSEEDGMVAYATTSYNTGWMQGRIKGAFLSDTDATNVTGSEKIANHDFTADFSTQWQSLNNATTSYDATNDRVTVTSTQNYSGIELKSASLPSLTAGKRYIMTVDIHSITNPIYFGVVSGLTVSNVNAAGVWTGVFTASNVTQVFISKPSGSNSTFVLNSVSIREAEEDRSVNNKGLQVYGTVTKSAVATGAELVSYSGFSNSTNYLSRPLNSDLAIGNSDFSCVGWFKKSTSSNTGMIIFASDGNNQIFDVRVHTDMKMLAQITDDAFSTREIVSAQGSTVNDDLWHQFHVVRRSNILYSYLDGNLLGSSSSVEANITNSMGITIGAENLSGNAKAFEGSLALIRFSKSAPSAEQIKKIYEDEKHLFQENAKCTLYGSSDAVTALAYDEDTELLHVGTSAGRSDFQGLRRINNTTTAVTTAISASDDLIAEQ